MLKNIFVNQNENNKTNNPFIFNEKFSKFLLKVLFCDVHAQLPLRSVEVSNFDLMSHIDKRKSLG